MAYVVETDVTGKIPALYLTEALDDDGDGKEDAGLFAQLVATASNDVDGYLSGLFATPFVDPAPAQVKAAALVFVCEAVYARRITADQKNPFTAQANFWRNRLQLIGEGKLPLDATKVPGRVGAAAGSSQAPVPGRIPVPPAPNPGDPPPNYP